MRVAPSRSAATDGVARPVNLVHGDFHPDSLTRHSYEASRLGTRSREREGMDVALVEAARSGDEGASTALPDGVSIDELVDG